MFVIQGLPGKPIAVICHDDQSSHSPYDQWRAQVWAPASHACAVPPPGRQEVRRAQEPARLKPLVGEWTVALKKSDALWGCDARGRARSSPGTPRGCHASRRFKPTPRVGGPAGSGPIGAPSLRDGAPRRGGVACGERSRGWARRICAGTPSGRPRAAHHGRPSRTRGGVWIGPRSWGRVAAGWLA